MGIDIVFLQDKQEITFSAQTSYFLSTTYAKIMTILISLIIVSKIANINIYTDSQYAIEILKFQKPKNKRWNTSANPIITQLIYETIKGHTGHINTFKVATHTGDRYNE